MNKVLVIEDEESIRANLLRLLKAEGFDAVGAPDGRAGLEAVRSASPDLVLCDVAMPELDGHAVLAALRADPATAALPFIFLTARADRSDVRQGMTAGADDYLTKPFTRDEVLDAIRSRLRLREAVAQFSAAQTKDMPEEAARMESALRGAIGRVELFLVYQPQVCLRQGHVLGVEALLRWKNADLGFVSPADFIPVAEASDLILNIGEWVLREACRQARLWRDSGLTTLKMGVNVSTRQLHDPKFADIVESTLSSFGLPGDAIDLEITESALARDVPAVASLLAHFKSLGISVSMDDFGTGYSGLSSLRQFPIDKLKIDRSFVTDLPAATGSVAIVSAIMQMAHHLNIRTLAEGVETPAELAYLREIGCDEMQGYFFSRPVPPADVVSLLASGKSLD